MKTKHWILMLLCCLIPIGIAFGLRAFGVALSASLPLVMLILCPLLHIMMMAFMHGPAQHDAASDPRSTARPDRLPVELRHRHEEIHNGVSHS